MLLCSFFQLAAGETPPLASLQKLNELESHCHPFTQGKGDASGFEQGHPQLTKDEECELRLKGQACQCEVGASDEKGYRLQELHTQRGFGDTEGLFSEILVLIIEAVRRAVEQEREGNEQV